MKIEAIVFTLLGIGGYFYLEAVDAKLGEINMMLHPSVEMVQRNREDVKMIKNSVQNLKYENTMILNRVDEILIRLERAGIK